MNLDEFDGPAENPGDEVPVDVLVDENGANAPPRITPAITGGADVEKEIDSKAENEFKMEKSPDQAPSVVPRDEVHHEQQMAGEEKEEDTVVREIEVFCNRFSDADSKLYVLQYPLRPISNPYEVDERCEEVRVIPATAEIELDLSMDVDSENYDKEVGARLKMTKHTLCTKWKPPPAIYYAVGALIGNKLHLNTVRAVVQLRTSMEHLSSTRKDKQSQGWIPLKYHGPRSNASSRYRRKIMAKDRSPIDFTIQASAYLGSLPKGERSDDESDSPSLRNMLSMPLEERIKKLLLDGTTWRRFTDYKPFCREECDGEVLWVLQEHAMLIQGLWTPKTELLKLADGLSLARDYVLVLLSKNPTIKASQVDAAECYKDLVKEILKTLATERASLNDWELKEPDDSFIGQFPGIVKQQKKILTKIYERVTIALESARLKGDGKKNARMESSVAVKSGKPVVNSDKKETRNVAVSRRSVAVPTRNVAVPTRNAAVPPRNIAVPPTNVAVPPRNVAVPSMSTRRGAMSEETRRALPKALKKVFQTHKVLSYQLICQKLRDQAISRANKPGATATMEIAAAYGADALPEELKEVISQVATEIHDCYVLTSSPNHPEHDSLRKVVMDLLRERGPDAKLKKTEVFKAAREVLGRDIKDKDYSKVMSSLCESKGKAWVLRRPICLK